MAALTATSVKRENMGSMNLLIMKFSSVDSGDTYDTNVSTRLIDHWARHSVGAGDTALLGISTSDNASGTITFLSGASDLAVTLFCMVKD